MNWKYIIENASPGTIITIPKGHHEINETIHVPEGVTVMIDDPLPPHQIFDLTISGGIQYAGDKDSLFDWWGPTEQPALSSQSSEAMPPQVK